jgi:ectoine hydroxylase-related dioxygenase (phytanoyl-CoA dioxygenase family)
MLNTQIEQFIRDGWVIIDIAQPDIIHEYAHRLEKKAQALTGTQCTLANMHTMVDDAAFKKLHVELAQYFWDSEFSIHAGKAFLQSMRDMMGLDIFVQYMPYLRLARPGKREDNIGYHKDTQYGQTPYELAVHVPFLDLDEAASLRVISASHRAPESDYLGEAEATSVTKGSMDHMLGKPYAPKNLTMPTGVASSSLAMRVGQAALFTPALFHGQEINRGSVTRVSTDLRFVNANAVPNLKIGKTRAGYVPLSCSPVQQAAADYYAMQPGANTGMQRQGE